jgi:allantoinase
MAQAPAKLAGLESRKGSIAPGSDADFVVFNPNAEFTVTTDRLHFRHAVTPYMGARLRGLVEQTFVRGNCVYRSGEFVGDLSGRECRV